MSEITIGGSGQINETYQLDNGTRVTIELWNSDRPLTANEVTWFATLRDAVARYTTGEANA